MEFNVNISTSTCSHITNTNDINFWHMALHLRMVCVLNHQVFLYMCVMLSDVMLWHEADLAIFKAMLAPLEDSTNNIVSKEEL